MIRIMVTLLLFVIANQAQACEQYEPIPLAELKEYRTKLLEPEADPFDRLFAFEQLSCSDKPTIRSFAIQEGMKSANNDIVRTEILLQAILQRRQIVIELISANPSKEVKKRIDRAGGAILETVRGKFPTEGCVSWSNDEECKGWFLQISGKKAVLNGNGYDGLFELSKSGELVGFVRFDRSTKVPAKIPLT